VAVAVAFKYRCTYQNTQKYLGKYSAQGGDMGDMRGYYGANGARGAEGAMWDPGPSALHWLHIPLRAVFPQIFLRILICASISQYFFKLLRLRENCLRRFLFPLYNAFSSGFLLPAALFRCLIDFSTSILARRQI